MPNELESKSRQRRLRWGREGEGGEGRAGREAGRVTLPQILPLNTKSFMDLPTADEIGLLKIFAEFLDDFL